MSKKLLHILLLSALLVLALPGRAETVWIDVRSSVEHWLDQIEGDPRISYGDILPEVEKRYPDRSTEFKLYCRSGGRAGKAEAALREAGYSNVENVGSIGDARKLRGIDS